MREPPAAGLKSSGVLMPEIEAIVNDIRQNWHLIVPLGVVGALSWSVWLYRKLASMRYRPVLNDFRTTTSVIVPSFHEDPDVLERCLEGWLTQQPTEVIVVLDVDDREAFRRLTARNEPALHVMVIVHDGKRSALGAGIRAATTELLVLTDSDTSWEPGLLEAIQMPFADSRVGAVGTRQNVYAPRSSLWRRVADWIIDIRYLDYVPATGRAGAVVCVSGRTAAYRRSVVLPVLHNLEHEYFLGRRCVAGDDGRLTWLVLASGYRTVHQDSARALSMFPDTFRAFCKQRTRWSRNSYRCYLTALWKGWLWRVPLISQVTVMQILLTPVTMLAAVYYLVASAALPQAGLAVSLAVAWFVIGRGIRSASHLRRRPSDLLILPLVAVVIVLVALPIKAYAFLTMNKQGWLTRKAGMVGGEGQREVVLPGRSGASQQPAPAAQTMMEPQPAERMPTRVLQPANGPSAASVTVPDHAGQSGTGLSGAGCSERSWSQQSIIADSPAQVSWPVHMPFPPASPVASAPAEASAPPTVTGPPDVTAPATDVAALYTLRNRQAPVSIATSLARNAGTRPDIPAVAEEVSRELESAPLDDGGSYGGSIDDGDVSVTGDPHATR